MGGGRSQMSTFRETHREPHTPFGGHTHTFVDLQHIPDLLGALPQRMTFVWLKHWKSYFTLKEGIEGYQKVAFVAEEHRNSKYSLTKLIRKQRLITSSPYVLPQIRYISELANLK